MSDTHVNFLRDLGDLIRREGESTKEDVAAATGDDKIFQQGRRMAYIEVLSLMQQQADAFGIPRKELRLDGLDPDNDLF